MHAFGNQFIQVEIARLERVLPGVRPRQREQVVHDVREPLRLVVQHS